MKLMLQDINVGNDEVMEIIFLDLLEISVEEREDEDD